MPSSQVEPENNGIISFTPSVIPDLVVTDRPMDKPESFRFEWLGNRFDIELFFNATYEDEIRRFSLRDFEDDFEVTVDYVVNRNDSAVQFGWVIDNVEDVSDLVHNAWFKIEDTQPFDYDEIELVTFEVYDDPITGEPIEPYNETQFVLPDNLVLSFEDLRHKGFVIGHQNKTATSIKGFSGKSWNLDPITYGAPIITVIGTYTNLHWELWNASNVNGWDCVWEQGSANYLINNTQVYLGNGTVDGTTVCSDLSVNVLFETNQRWGYYVTNYATLTFGQQDSGFATSQGVNVNWNSSYGSGNTAVIRGSSTSGNSKLNLYSCSLKSTYNDHPEQYISQIPYFSASAPNVVIYNCFFDKVYISGYCDIYNLAIFRGLHGLSNVEGTLQQIFLYDIRYAIAVTGASKTTKDVNVIAVDALTGVRYIGGGNPHYLVNVDWSGASNWRFYWHSAVATSIYRQYEFDLTMYFMNGSQAQNANVTISNDYLGTSDSWLTFANGSVPQQTYSYGHYNQTGVDTIYDYNPYNLTVTLDDYQTYTTLFNITQKEDWGITLTEEVPTPPSGVTFNSVYYLVGLATFLPFLLLLIRKRRKNGD